MSKLLRLLAAVGVFALVGPPVGGLVTWVAMGARTMRSPLPFVTGSYGEGLLLAVAAGALVGAATLWLGKASWVVPVVVAIVINGVMLAIDAVAEPARAPLVAASIAGVFFPASLIATLACWWLTRRLLRPA
jgi:hypothetical protein